MSRRGVSGRIGVMDSERARAPERLPAAPPIPLEDIAVTEHPFPLPWIVKEITGGYTVLDANGTSLGYFYVRTSQVSREHARLLAMNFARLPTLLGDDQAAAQALRDSADLTWWNGSLAAG
jgi:hypothetical protein